MKIIGIAMALGLLSGSAALGQDSSCLEIKGPSTIDAPTGAEKDTQIKIVDIGSSATVKGLEFTLVGGKWSLDAQSFAKILALKDDPGRKAMTTGWFKDGSLQTSRPFFLPGEDRGVVCHPEVASVNPPSASPGAIADILTHLNLEDCRPLMDNLVASKMQKLGSNHFVVILFKPTGDLCIQSKPTATSGDLIYTAVVDNGAGSQAPSIEFTKCDAPSLSPNNPEGETLASKVQKGEQRSILSPIEFPVRQCFGSSAQVTVKNKFVDTAGPHEVSKATTVTMFDKFRFSLQVGLLASAQHSHTFGLRKDGNDMKIFDKGPTGTGPEYVATVILYGLPHYFGFGNPPKGNGDGEKEALASYFGRDPFHENSFADHLGLVLGAGLNSPGDRVVAGLSYEIGYGINLIGVYEYAKLKELVGVSEGNVFTGTAEQIPTRDSWKGRWIGGVSIDMRYFTRLIKRSTS